MKKQIATCTFATLLSFAAFSASAMEISFPVETYNFAYHAEDLVRLRVGTGDGNESAFLEFRRDRLPEDRIHRDPSSGIVTLTYSISELGNIQRLLEDSSSVFFNYTDRGTSESAYLYSNQ